jgi:YtkA-like
VRVVLLAAPGSPRVGRSRFVAEFRDARSGALVDVGTVAGGGTMPMPGMTMATGLRVTSTTPLGRYELEGEFGMAGVWSFTLSWSGPSTPAVTGPRGPGRAPFELEVH